MRGQATIELSNSKGLFARGMDDACPSDHFIDAKDVEYDGHDWKTRGGLGRLLSGSNFNNIIAIYPYVSRGSGDVRRFLMLLTNGNVTDSSDPGTSLIAYGPGDILGWSCIKLFGRIYVSPHNLGSGLGNSTTGLARYVGVIIIGRVTAVAINDGGAGYSVNEILTLKAGNSNCKLIVTTVAAGVITAVSIIHPGNEYTTDDVAVQVSGGAGSGATFDVSTVNNLGYPAAGAAPSGFTLGAAAGVAGKCEAGRRLFAVAYETETGHITAPGPTSWTLFNLSPGSKKIDISSIPLGPSGTIARHILASKVIFNYNVKNFNQLEHELFYIPDGKIENNTATTLTVDFYDSELLSSADYLIDQLDPIPPGVKLTAYNGRLAIGSTKDSPYTVWVSKAGAPESINSVDGAIVVAPDDNTGSISGSEFVGCSNLFVQRGNLFITKYNRTYVTQDNGMEPASWRVDLIDAGVGSSCYGVGNVLDYNGVNTDFVVVAHSSGLRLFNGSYLDIPLSYKIEDLWDDLFAGTGQTSLQVWVDSIDKKIYVRTPAGASLSLRVWICDYKDGLSPELVRWSYWSLSKFPNYIALGSTASTRDFNRLYVINSGVAGIFEVSSSYTDDFGSANNDTAIDSYVESALLQFDPEEGISQFSALRLRVTGSGNLNITLSDQDRQRTSIPPVLALSTSPGKPLFRLLNFLAERCAVKLGTNVLTHRFTLHKMILAGSKLYEERPA